MWCCGPKEKERGQEYLAMEVVILACSLDLELGLKSEDDMVLDL